MSPRTRWTVLLGLLAGAAVLVATDDSSVPPTGVVEATPPRPRPSTPPAAASPRAPAPDDEPVVLAIRERPAPPSPGEAFPNRDWRPPPPKAAEPPPPQPPTAPPLPYTVLGKKLEDGQWQVFLLRGDRIHVVKRSDTLDNVYRVQDIAPPYMTLTFLPLQQEQRLPIGGPE